MRDNQSDEGWREAYEACISATGSMLMSAVGHLTLPEQSPDVVIECVAATCCLVLQSNSEQQPVSCILCRATSALVRWMGSAEPFVSAAGMRARDR